MSSALTPLIDVIVNSAADLDKALKRGGGAIPDLSQPFHPASEAFRADAEASDASARIVAAALQLAATVAPPVMSLYQIIGGPFRAAALRVCLESHVTEILREAGPKGLHVNEIGKKNGQDPKKLARFLRILATSHIYAELEPNVFTNTRLSSMLDSGKPSAEVISKPEEKHDGTPGLTALAGHHLDECFKASAFAWDTLADPALSHSEEPTEAAVSTWLGRNVTVWDFFGEKDQEFRRKRFDIAMQGVAAFIPPTTVPDAFDWASLPKGSTVIDVGGGVGASVASLVDVFPHLNYIVQDLNAAKGTAEKFWQTTNPKALTEKRVVIEAHDFFTPQPKRDVAVYMLKHILHDWSDAYSKKILSQLRASASSNTRLLLVEGIVPYACRLPADTSSEEVPGARGREAPEPLLPNYGANSMIYPGDMVMHIACNSQERTFHHMQELLLSSGWKLVRVRRQAGDNSLLHGYESIPA